MTATILIVDDEESIRRSVADILSDEGYRPVVAEDGDEGLAKLRTDPPDLVLLDIAMPGRDGIEVLEELRKSWSELPVVMMSGHGTIETAVRATKLGAYDFLEKPLSCDKLLLCVAHGLESARRPRVGCSSPGKTAPARSSSHGRSTSDPSARDNPSSR
jgi:two-component system nitrogen regulation response regulator NtrX